MGFFSTISFITRQHAFSKKYPVTAVKRYVQWQWHARVNAKPLSVPWTNRTELWLAPGLRGATGNHYCGLHEFEDMSFLLHLLRPQDHFADVGANTGTYTVLAAAHVGAKTTAFEPVPAALYWLHKNIETNNINQRVRVVEKAVSNLQGFVHFTSHLDAMNHVLEAQDDKSISVACTTLDEELLADEPILIKIDVEGNEHNVLQGSLQLLASPKLKALIVESANQPFIPLGKQTVHQWMLEQGFSAFTYQPFNRTLIPLSQPHHHNTIYLCNIDFVQNRLQSSPPFGLWGKSI